MYLSECPVSVNLNVTSKITFSGFNDWRYYGQCTNNGNKWGITCLMIRHYNAGNQYTKGYDDHPACYLHGGVGGSERGTPGSYWLSTNCVEDYHVDPSPLYEFIENVNTSSESSWVSSKKILSYWCDLCYSYQFWYYGKYNGPEWSGDNNLFHMGNVSFQVVKSGIKEQVSDDVELRYAIHSYRSKREVYNYNSLNTFSNTLANFWGENAWWVQNSDDPIIQKLNED